MNIAYSTVNFCFHLFVLHPITSLTIILLIRECRRDSMTRNGFGYRIYRNNSIISNPS